MHNDILSTEKPMIGDKIGQYNRQFIVKWSPVFARSFGAKASKVNSMDLTSLITEMQNINKKID
jgi:hypothetical protein